MLSLLGGGERDFSMKNKKVNRNFEYETLKEACKAAREKVLTRQFSTYGYVYLEKNGMYTIWDKTENLETTNRKFQVAVDKAGNRYVYKKITDMFGQKHLQLVRIK